MRNITTRAARAALPIAATALVFLAGGCVRRLRPQYWLIVNVSASSHIVDEPTRPSVEQASRLTDVTILAAKPGLLYVAAAGREPLVVPMGTRGLDSGQVFTGLRLARVEQVHGPDANPRALIQPDMFGEGTNHAAPLRNIVTSALPGPRRIVVLTDGFNETFAFEDVRKALKDLFKTGDTRVYIFGLSQRVVDKKSGETVLDMWRKAMLDAGAHDLAADPSASLGFYLQSNMTLPRGFAEQLQH